MRSLAVQGCSGWTSHASQLSEEMKETVGPRMRSGQTAQESGAWPYRGVAGEDLIRPLLREQQAKLFLLTGL